MKAPRLVLCQFVFVCAVLIVAASCNEKPSAGLKAAASDSTLFRPGSFGYDLHFIRQHDTGLILLKEGSAQVIVSPKYQAKVFTSTNAGDSGRSFGWVHYKAFEGPADAHMNAYGGENRLWLGPEGGRFSLFFRPGTKMEFANWKTPREFDTESWDVLHRSDTSAELRKDMLLTNYAGSLLRISVDRKITILDSAGLSNHLFRWPGSGVHVVGYETINTLTNTGGTPWTATTGMPCIWMLDMFPPSASTVIYIPYRANDAMGKGRNGKPATTDYFGEIPADRIRFEGHGNPSGDGMLFFKADGKYRSKIGIHPFRATSVALSYDNQRKVLTMAQFDVFFDKSYLNQEWNTEKAPFSGDAVNAYNDGPLADGSQMGPFYELESVSPAAFLSPGQSQVHRHVVYHFTGTEEQLDTVTRMYFNIPLAKIRGAF
jgi:hypothetical protein